MFTLKQRQATRLHSHIQDDNNLHAQRHSSVFIHSHSQHGKQTVMSQAANTSFKHLSDSSGQVISQLQRPLPDNT